MSGFDQLERQLRRTVARRAVRRRRAPLLRTLSIAAAVAVTVAAVAAAATGVIGGRSSGGVDGLLDTVSRATQHVPVCQLHGPSRAPAELSASPASALARRSFPALRRAPTPDERGLARKYARIFGSAPVLSDGARLLHATDGTRFLLIVTPGYGQGLMPRPGCTAVKLAELDRLAPHLRPALVAQARRLLERDAAQYRLSAGREFVTFLQLARGGRSVGGGATSTETAVRLGTGTIGGVRVDGLRHSVVTGLVPEPVAYVTLTPRSGHARAVRVPVPEQVFHAVLPQGFGNHVVVQWHTSSGRVVHVQHWSY